MPQGQYVTRTRGAVDSEESRESKALSFALPCNAIVLHEKDLRDETEKKSLASWIFLVVFFTVVLWCFPHAWAAQSANSKAKIRVFVSILPQAYFVERVGGDYVAVSVMVGPGHSPATYEPMPMQMAGLGEAKLYFAIGVPFEKVWISRISKTNPELRIIETNRGIELLPMTAHDHHGGKGQHGHDKGEAHHHLAEGIKDPHIWLSLRLVKIQARNICNALIEEDPVHRAYYDENLESFHRDLDSLDSEITAMLTGLKSRTFMILHPALGYFAHDYGLEQIPIEIEGKQPSARALARLIQQAKDSGIRVILVQKQFSSNSAEAVARAIGGKVARIDPLSKAYLENMRKIAETFSRVLK